MRERVQLADKSVILVGTAHVSAESAAEVEQVIDDEDPDVVCVELDADRYESLQEEERWKNLEVRDALRDGKGSLLLLNIVLSIYQQQVGDAMDIRPGEEMLAAIDAAEAHGTPVELIDRDIQDTIQDTIQSLSLREKFKLLSYGIYGWFADEEVTETDIEELKESNMVDSIVDELGEAFPGLKTQFLDKRDAYMARRIQETDADTVVAVVGAAHVRGIAEHLRSGDIPAVEPPEERLINPLKAVKYGVPALIVGMFAWILYSLGFAAARDAFLVWFALNAGLSGIAAALAKSHPFTVIAAALTAPFASVNPAMPTGLIAAYVENRFHPPTVGDLEEIGAVADYSAFWTNSALRLLLVFFLVNMGSAIASYIGAGYLAHVLAGA